MFYYEVTGAELFECEIIEQKRCTLILFTQNESFEEI